MKYGKVPDISRPTRSNLSKVEMQKLFEARVKIEKQISQQIEACENSNRISSQDLLITVLSKQ